MAKVAVILTSYNRPNMIQKSIKSVLRQTFKDFTFYIMDDNSVNQVKQVLRRYKDPRIKLWFSDVKNKDRTRTCRYAVLINKGLRMGSEPLITMLTDDCGMYRNKLADMVRYMQSHPKVDICYGNQQLTQLTHRQQYEKIHVRGTFGVVTRPGGVLDHNQIMFRRRILAKVGYWDESAAHWCDKDAVWFNVIASKGYKFHPVNKLTDWMIMHPKRVTEFAVKGKWQDLKKGSLME